MQDRTFIEIQAGIPKHRNSKYYRLNSVENNHGSWLLVGILQLAGNQLLGVLKITVVVQYNTVGIWLPVPVVIYFQSLVPGTCTVPVRSISTAGGFLAFVLSSEGGPVK